MELQDMKPSGYTPRVHEDIYKVQPAQQIILLVQQPGWNIVPATGQFGVEEMALEQVITLHPTAKLKAPFLNQ